MFIRSAFRRTHLFRMFDRVNLSTLPITKRYLASTSFENSKVWTKMSEHERMNCALAESDPQTAKMAFYKGKALMLHQDYNAAIHAFELAKGIDPNYTTPSNEAVAIIYNKIGKKKTHLT